MNDDREAIDSVRTFSWWLIVAMLVALVSISHRDPFALDPRGAVLPLMGLITLAAAMWFGRRSRRPRLALASEAFLQMTLFTMLGVVLAYAIAARGGVLWDDRLAAADRALGFDWPAMRALLDHLPPLIWLLGLAYHSLVLQMIVAIVALSQTGRTSVLRITVGAAILSGFVTILVSGLFPAMGNVFDPAAYRHLWPSIAWLETDLIGGLRDGSIRIVDLGAMMGIVTFPSFHATLALIFIWAFGHLPRFALPAQCWAGLTIVATPVFGGHYAVDVLAGLALAPPAIILMRRLARPVSVASALVRASV
jgi:hypothetical protein